MDCLLCSSLSGEQRLYPGPTIIDGQYWQLEHNYPTSLKGWLTFVLKRHTVALHELTTPEFTELTALIHKVAPMMRDYFECEKEYLAHFAEGEKTRHVHVHLIAKPATLPDDVKGAKVFSLLGVSPEKAVPVTDIITHCQKLKQRLE